MTNKNQKETTRHGKKRIKERVGVPKSASSRQQELARERGLPHAKTSGRLSKWVTSVALNPNHTKGQYYIYNNNLFIYKTDKVVTVLPVPQNLRDLVVKQTKKMKAHHETKGIDIHENSISSR